MSQWVAGVRLRGWSIALLTTGAIGWAGAALSQSITLDGTLGPQQTLTGPVYQIRQEDGRSIGSNLFHSFGRFNLLTGERANFASSAAIRNILARVTGGARSEIDGLIFTNSAAVNLFLINPSGILFGPNARLDVGGSQRGSFVATTTDALIWPDGSQFNAHAPNDGDSLLRIVGDPSGFLAARQNLRPIEVRGGTTNQDAAQTMTTEISVDRTPLQGLRLEDSL